MIRVLVADDQAVVRGGLRMILEAQADLEVVGEAADGSEAITMVASLQPDVVLMDIRMPGVDGIEATRRLVQTSTRTRVLVLTTYALDEYVYESLKAGAAGFFVKTESPERLVEAVRLIAASETLLAPAITRRLIDRFLQAAPPNAPPPAALTELTTPRAGRTAANRARPIQRRNRQRPVHHRRDRENARGPHPHEARPARPRSSSRIRIRARPRATRTANRDQLTRTPLSSEPSPEQAKHAQAAESCVSSGKRVSRARGFNHLLLAKEQNQLSRLDRASRDLVSRSSARESRSSIAPLEFSFARQSSDAEAAEWWPDPGLCDGAG